MRDLLRVIALATLATFSGAVPARAQGMPDFLNEDKPRAQVLLLGTFHFRDAGLDSHQPQHGFDAMSEARQKEIAEVLDLLEAFQPTVIAVERRNTDQASLDERYAKYLAGEFEIGANEVFQIGFRLGKRLGLPRLAAVDAAGRSYFPDMTEEEYEAKVASLLEGIDPAKEHWVNMWLQSNTDGAPGFVSGFFYGGLEDGEIRLRASGEDAQGAFIDNIRFTAIETNSFTWRMSRSYDGGKSWREDLAVTRARRIR